MEKGEPAEGAVSDIYIFSLDAITRGLQINVLQCATENLTIKPYQMSVKTVES
jgi:hypothetical protein